jgi:hypothetical protein
MERSPDAPPDCVVVMLRRPKLKLGEVPQFYPDGPWALTPRDDMDNSVPIQPTPELQAMMPGREGLFYARRIVGGWDIIGPVE